jgi:hypothetical protein
MLRYLFDSVREVKCPAGYWRADDDETGACVPLPEEPNPIPEPPCAEGTIPDPEGSGECIIAPTEEEPEPEEELTANCGGVPCTPSDKEAGTGSDIIVEEEELQGYSLFVSNEDGDVKTMLLKTTNDNQQVILVLQLKTSYQYLKIVR